MKKIILTLLSDGQLLIDALGIPVLDENNQTTLYFSYPEGFEGYTKYLMLRTRKNVMVLNGRYTKKVQIKLSGEEFTLPRALVNAEIIEAAFKLTNEDGDIFQSQKAAFPSLCDSIVSDCFAPELLNEVFKINAGDNIEINDGFEGNTRTLTVSMQSPLSKKLEISDINGMESAFSSKEEKGAGAEEVLKHNEEYGVHLNTIGEISSLLTTAKDTVVGGLNSLVSEFKSHIANKYNPHRVTKSQLGLGNVNNTSDAAKPLSNAAIEALSEKQSISEKNKPGGYAGLDANGALSVLVSQKNVMAQVVVSTPYPDSLPEIMSDGCTVKLANHGFEVNTLLEFTDGEGALPSGLVKKGNGKAYAFVASVAQDTFTLKALRSDNADEIITLGTDAVPGFLCRKAGVSSFRLGGLSLSELGEEFDIRISGVMTYITGTPCIRLIISGLTEGYHYSYNAAAWKGNSNYSITLNQGSESKPFIDSVHNVHFKRVSADRMDLDAEVAYAVSGDLRSYDTPKNIQSRGYFENEGLSSFERITFDVGNSANILLNGSVILLTRRGNNVIA